MTSSDVKSKNDLVVFIKQLEFDISMDECSWENVTLDRYFEAMSGWLNDIDETTFFEMISKDKQLIWRAFAYMLDAATIYE